MSITMTPGVASGPLFGNVTFSLDEVRRAEAQQADLFAHLQQVESGCLGRGRCRTPRA